MTGYTLYVMLESRIKAVYGVIYVRGGASWARSRSSGAKPREAAMLSTRSVGGGGMAVTAAAARSAVLTALAAAGRGASMRSESSGAKPARGAAIRSESSGVGRHLLYE